MWSLVISIAQSLLNIHENTKILKLKSTEVIVSSTQQKQQEDGFHLPNLYKCITFVGHPVS